MHNFHNIRIILFHIWIHIWRLRWPHVCNFSGLVGYEPTYKCLWTAFIVSRFRVAFRTTHCRYYLQFYSNNNFEPFDLPEIHCFYFQGWLYDALESYNPGFFTAGGMITLSGLILFFIPLVQRKVQKNVNNQVAKTAINNEPA